MIRRMFKVLRMLVRPLRKLTWGLGQKRMNGFYKIRIVNRSKQVVWLAKNTNGDLHDIIPVGHSLEIRLPIAHRMEFFAYKSSSNLSVTGLDYYAKKEFTQNEEWVIH